MHSYDNEENSIADFTIACENTIVGISRLPGRFAFFFVTAISETFFLAGTAFFTSLNNEYESYWMIDRTGDVLPRERFDHQFPLENHTHRYHI